MKHVTGDETLTEGPPLETVFSHRDLVSDNVYLRRQKRYKIKTENVSPLRKSHNINSKERTKSATLLKNDTLVKSL